METTDEQKKIIDAAIATYIGEREWSDCNFPASNGSERCIEALWMAYHLINSQAKNVLDIGLSLCSLDLLGFILWSQETQGIKYHGVDIINPNRVLSRYPKEWQKTMATFPCTIGDIRKIAIDESSYDAVTCISTLEHIGFDRPADHESATAFDRVRDQSEAQTNRDPEIDHEVLDVFANALRPQGVAIITVPMGKGGPTILRDSMGYIAVQWEYEKHTWEKLCTHPAFTIRDQRFFAYRGNWVPVDGTADLTTCSSHMKPFAEGCALLCLERR